MEYDALPVSLERFTGLDKEGRFHQTIYVDSGLEIDLTILPEGQAAPESFVAGFTDTPPAGFQIMLETHRSGDVVIWKSANLIVVGML